MTTPNLNVNDGFTILTKEQRGMSEAEVEEFMTNDTLPNFTAHAEKTSKEEQSQQPTETDVRSWLSKIVINDAEPIIAATTFTSAMIALIPTVKDVQRIAIDGGEEPDIIHLTLAYLGKAANIPQEVKIKLIDNIVEYCETFPTIVGNIFSVNVFNPTTSNNTDKSPCVTWGVSGELIENIHKCVVKSSSNIYIDSHMTFPQQHEPWIPHITATYISPDDNVDLSEFESAIGPITFDRIRLAFGNEIYDVPLGENNTSDLLSSDSNCNETENELCDETGIKFDANGHPIVPNILLDWRSHVVAEKERDVNIPGGGHNLRNYWVYGPGAAKIVWGTDGSFARCVMHLGKYVRDPHGLCAEYHKRATGEWPAEKGIPSSAETITTEFDPNQPHDHIDNKLDTDQLSSTSNEMLYSNSQEIDLEKGAATMPMAVGSDAKKPYGEVEYADPGYQDDGVSRYPIDTEAHIRAAWAYINMPKNAKKYSSQDLERVRKRIIAAMRKIGVEISTNDEELVSAIIALIDTDLVSMTRRNMSSDTLNENGLPTSSTKPPEWSGVISVEGIKSGDGRMFGPNSLTWDTPPLPLMWQKETSHGGTNNVSVRVGSVDRVWREPMPNGCANTFMIMASGTIDLGCADGREIHRRLSAGYAGGNSVDVDSVSDSSIEFQYPSMTNSNGVTGMPFEKPNLTIYHEGRIRATTFTEIPAFIEARIGLVNVPNSTKITNVDECLNCTSDELIAAATIIEISDAPPREWFNEPNDVTPCGALTVTNKGRLYGYIAPAGVRHRSKVDRFQYVPMGNVDYSRFMSGETIVADGGRIVTGRITMNCNHATTNIPLTATQASTHYENSCTVVASVCVGENQHGVWVAGALIGNLDSQTIQRIMACSLSGDWRPHLDKPGWREFVAALLVPVPGFPMPRTAASVKVIDGELVASSVPVIFVNNSDIINDNITDSGVVDNNVNDNENGDNEDGSSDSSVDGNDDISSISTNANAALTTDLDALRRKITLARVLASACKSRRKIKA